MLARKERKQRKGKEREERKRKKKNKAWAGLYPDALRRYASTGLGMSSAGMGRGARDERTMAPNLSRAEEGEGATQGGRDDRRQTGTKEEKKEDKTKQKKRQREQGTTEETEHLMANHSLCCPLP